MKKGIKLLGVMLIMFAGFAGFRYYKIKTFKDTHDLQQQVALKCNNYINDGKSVGMAVGIIQGDKIYIGCFGKLARDGRAVDSNTIFEIGSITKVFTAELVQILVDRGTIKWDENIYDIFPPEYKPTVNDNTTLLSLATHTSGFPKTPQILLDQISDPCNPYKDMKREEYEACIKNLTGKKKPDSTNYKYSNMGFSVLANCAAIKAGHSYDSLLQTEILNVLGMGHTSLQNTDALNFAIGYDSHNNPACHWDIPPFYTGCGGLRSNITDMVKFLNANLNDNQLYKPFSETQKQVYKTPLGGVGKGWEIWGVGGHFVWKNGGTGGFKSYIAMMPEKKTGIVILSNKYIGGLDMLGQDMLTLASKVSLK